MLPTANAAVLLDLDGTVVDSLPGIRESCIAALRELGHTPANNLDVRSLIGPPLEDVLKVLLQSCGDFRLNEAVEAYRRHYGETGYLGSVPYPGIRDSLEKMRENGLRLYLATSKRLTFATRILEHLTYTSLFDGIYGSVPGGKLDQKAELLAHIISERELTPSACIMVGDRSHDMVGAHSVGMWRLGVLWGYGTADELKSSGAAQLVTSPLDLAAAVSSLL